MPSRRTSQQRLKRVPGRQSFKRILPDLNPPAFALLPATQAARQTKLVSGEFYGDFVEKLCRRCLWLSAWTVVFFEVRKRVARAVGEQSKADGKRPRREAVCCCCRRGHANRRAPAFNTGYRRFLSRLSPKQQTFLAQYLLSSGVHLTQETICRCIQDR